MPCNSQHKGGKLWYNTRREFFMIYMDDQKELATTLKEK